MSAPFGGRARFGPADLALYAVGLAGLAMCLTLVFFRDAGLRQAGDLTAEEFEQAKRALIGGAAS